MLAPLSVLDGGAHITGKSVARIGSPYHSHHIPSVQPCLLPAIASLMQPHLLGELRVRNKSATRCVRAECDIAHECEQVTVTRTLLRARSRKPTVAASTFGQVGNHSRTRPSPVSGTRGRITSPMLTRLACCDGNDGCRNLESKGEERERLKEMNAPLQLEVVSCLFLHETDTRGTTSTNFLGA
ncbi:hypothetical protein BD626DRAFT_632044 [Schizophyllum amplum]|uniref:Uncharacterized protein n=1 Tax=Schizophyllum amplum TaxID=97359 RepID=A0A550C8L1_9AGAR|nr:hypothetical protein BD626DRAFT_632044 [Auriculariopsis ampla]